MIQPLTPQSFVEHWKPAFLSETAAYGWAETMGDEEILERLLAPNLERAGGT